jgi:hypothetical protein
MADVLARWGVQLLSGKLAMCWPLLLKRHSITYPLKRTRVLPSFLTIETELTPVRAKIDETEHAEGHD